LLLDADADVSGNIADLGKSTFVFVLAMAGPNTSAPLLGIIKAQSATSHSSTESEAMSLECDLRTERLPALDFGDVEVGESQHQFWLTACEDNEAVSKIALKTKPAAMWHISRTHRVNLIWIYEAL
jgi:hypothetical protein